MVRRELAQQLHRLASLTAAAALDAGIAARLAGAAVRRLRPDEYAAIKQAARLDAVHALRRRRVLEALGVEREAGDVDGDVDEDQQADEAAEPSTRGRERRPGSSGDPSEERRAAA